MKGAKELSTFKEAGKCHTSPTACQVHQPTSRFDRMFPSHFACSGAENESSPAFFPPLRQKKRRRKNRLGVTSSSIPDVRSFGGFTVALTPPPPPPPPPPSLFSRASLLSESTFFPSSLPLADLMPRGSLKGERRRSEKEGGGGGGGGGRHPSARLALATAAAAAATPFLYAPSPFSATVGGSAAGDGGGGGGGGGGR